ncbi:sulfotransferase [Alphaproteobacteria bacterium]|nr:sulfotransferase [Alphaproteobacteria bacterium]
MSAESNTGSSLKSVQDAIEANDFGAAKALLEPILLRTPDLFDAHYMACVCARYLNEGKQAQHHIDRMKTLYPDFGRVYQEEGHLYAKTDPERALRSYRHASRQNPALLASWRGQADLLAAKGWIAAAEAALANGKSVAVQPEALQAAMNHMYEGRLSRAEELCRGFLSTHKHHVEGMRLLAQLALRHGENDQAEFILETILAFAPGLDDVRLEYIEVLKNRQKIELAREQSAQLVQLSPNNIQNLSVHAINLMQSGDYDEALAFFDKTLARAPKDAATLTSKGHALKTMGREDEAIGNYRQAVRAKPDHGDGYYSLANLKTYRFDADEMKAMTAQMARDDLLPADRVHISFALAKAHEDGGDYAAAFANYYAGNESKKRQIGYTAEAMQAELQRQQDICTAALFAKQAGQGHAAPDPIFIVGLPRAGSTLLEQILASHSQIDGTLELPNILSLSHKLRGRQKDNVEVAYPQVLHDLSAEQLQQFGREFIEDTQMHRQGAPFFIDKMPNNFRHIGLIQLILPNAKIIDARRDPMDCCFSGFKQLFAQGQEFTYGLEEIGRYYVDYVALMDHWHEVLPGKILHVQHEDVLEDLEGQVRKMLDYLGLPFEPACLDFHNTERAVRTASSAQVRQPLNRKGVAAWRPFEAYLTPLKDALGDHFNPPVPE